MNAVEKLENKRILIWGYGREGKSTENFLKNHVTCDVSVFEGKLEDIDTDLYDYIFKSPGIVLESDDSKFTSATQLFLELFSDKVIGITGTKGKSTTSSLMYHVLKECTDKKVILLGNIGLPCLDYYDEIDDNTIIVFELSCHQLAHTTVSPHIGVILNLYEEHLDYYKTLENYYKAKCNIGKHQYNNDYLYLGENVPAFNTKSNQIIIHNNDALSCSLPIYGEHNKLNAAFVEIICKNHFGISPAKTEEAMQSFPGLPHRLAFVRKKDDISYYDDSISTIPEAAIQALESIPNAHTILLGGMDRGIDYTLLTSYIKAHPEYVYICAYASGKRIFDEAIDYPGVYYRNDLQESMALAKELTPRGKSIILSPASASYGYFKNFEERGDVFASLI